MLLINKRWSPQTFIRLHFYIHGNVTVRLLNLRKKRLPRILDPDLQSFE